jgi:hypothetical protein
MDAAPRPTYAASDSGRHDEPMDVDHHDDDKNQQHQQQGNKLTDN